MGCGKMSASPAGKLQGKLRLAAAGTSRIVDITRSLVSQGILKAVSVGFLPTEVEPVRNGKGVPTGGLRIKAPQLLEASLVSVPANPDALAIAKALNLTDLERAWVFSENNARRAILKSQPRGSGDTRNRQPRNPTNMSLTQKIEAAQARVAGLQDDLTDHMNVDDGERDDTHGDVQDQLTKELEEANAELDRLERAEKVLMKRVTKPAAKSDTDSDNSGSPVTFQRKNEQPGTVMVRAMLCTVKGYLESRNVHQVAAELYAQDREVAEMVKATSAPADTTTAGWAAELVNEAVGSFLEALRPVSVYPQVPGLRLNFGRNGTIKIPGWGSTGGLSGGFVGEGAPIPVKEGAVTAQTMAAHKLAVISLFTREIGNHSQPAIEGLIRQAILDDTAEALDAAFLGTAARRRDQARRASEQRQRHPPRLLRTRPASSRT